MLIAMSQEKDATTRVWYKIHKLKLVQSNLSMQSPLLSSHLY